MSLKNLLFSTSWITNEKVEEFVNSINGLQCEAHVSFEGQRDAVINQTSKVAIANDYDVYFINLNCVINNKKAKISLIETFCFDRGWFDNTKSFVGKEYKISYKNTVKGRVQFISEKDVGESLLGHV